MAILSSEGYRGGAFPLTEALATAVLLLVVVGLSACSLAPTYQRPAAPIPARLNGNGEHVSGTVNKGTTPVELSESERVFLTTFSPHHDLTALVKRALENNRDFRIAALQVQQARVLNRIDRAQQLPAVAAAAQFERQHFNNPGLDERYGQNLSAAAIGVSDFELDFFGRVRNLSDASNHRYLASVEGQCAFRGALIAEVLRAYVIERAASAAAEQLQAVDADTQTMLSMTERQQQVGTLSQDELNLLRSDAEHTHMRLLQAQVDETTSRNALQLIVGYVSTDTAGTFNELSSLDEPLDSVASLPSEVLLQRPDIMQAEGRLRASNADIGAARAAFFPSIQLSTSLGTASNGLIGLFESGTGVWTFVPQITLPIFDYGRNRANLELAQLRNEQAVAEYEKVVQSAFHEVSEALTIRGPLIERLHREQALLATERERVGRAGRRFNAGWEDRPTLLAARVRLAHANVSCIESQQALTLNRLALYRALYGAQIAVLPSTAKA